MAEYVVWSLRIAKGILEDLDIISEYERVGRAELVREWIRAKVAEYRNPKKWPIVTGTVKRREQARKESKQILEEASIREEGE